MSYPLEVTVEPEGNVLPGLIATATLRVAVARAMGQVELEVVPGDGLQLVSQRRISLDRLVPGEVYEQQLAVRLPASLERRVVEITVRGWMNGAPIERSAVWNLLPGGDEASREVIRPDGSIVREVAARRVR